MESRLISLGLVLEELGIDPKKADQYKKAQYALYLAQFSGYSLGYHFQWMKNHVGFSWEKPCAGQQELTTTSAK